jgi:hypothetical protein
MLEENGEVVVEGDGDTVNCDISVRPKLNVLMFTLHFADALVLFPASTVLSLSAALDQAVRVSVAKSGLITSD